MNEAIGNPEVMRIQKLSWTSVPLEELTPLLSRRVVSGVQAMVAHVHLKAGCIVPKHAHVNEQISWIMQGALRFWLGDKADSEDIADSLIVSAGEVLIIPSHVPHRAVALADTLDIDIFSPPREDWLAGTDSYLRGR